jgi:hypothetical protein
MPPEVVLCLWIFGAAIAVSSAIVALAVIWSAVDDPEPESEFVEVIPRPRVQRHRCYFARTRDDRFRLVFDRIEIHYADHQVRHALDYLEDESRRRRITDEEYVRIRSDLQQFVGEKVGA